MIDFVHENYALGIVYLFNMIQMLITFSLELWKSLSGKDRINQQFEISSLSATLRYQKILLLLVHYFTVTATV